MTRVTVRVEDELKEEMDQHGDVNWSEFIRESIKERLSEADQRQIQKLVKGYDGDLVRIFSLYMFAERLNKRYIYETIEEMFDEAHDDVVDGVADDIEDLHIDRMYQRTPDGESYGDIIIEEIENAAGEDIRTYVRNRISSASDTEKIGLSLLPHFVRDRIDDDGTRIIRQSLKRTWSIRADSEVDPDTLLGTGLLFRSYYSSNAYGYSTYQVPGYALDIIEEIDRHPTQFDVPIAHPDTTMANSIKETDDFAVFLDWMEGMTKYVPKHSEEEDIQEFLTDVEMTYEEFQDLRHRLVESNMLIIEYRPHRSSTGGRSSRPSKWKYQFTEPAQQHLAGRLAE